MLHITIPSQSFFNDATQEFVETKEVHLSMEHSLVSISKWEAKYEKSFLSTANKTDDEVKYYIQCMIITQNVDPYVINFLTAKNIEDIMNYINAPMTATTFKEDKESKKNSRKVITSEEIYSWMISLQIPFECQKWHINRLLTLIRVCGIRNKPPKKMSKKEVMAQNSALNAERMARRNTHG